MSSAVKCLKRAIYLALNLEVDVLVTEIKKISDKRYKIVLEDGSSFPLYVGEVRKFDIRENEDLPEVTLTMIYREVLSKRVKMRCMNLLKTMDRTVEELRTKLKQDGYPESIVEEALNYVASYHYTDDERYARNYVRLNAGRKSRTQIAYALSGKGVDRELINRAFDELTEESGGADMEESERTAILRLAEKRHYDEDTAEPEERQKFYAFLQRKGFSYSAIKAALQE